MSLGIFKVVLMAAHLRVAMTLNLALLVLALTVCMCIIIVRSRSPKSACNRSGGAFIDMTAFRKVHIAPSLLFHRKKRLALSVSAIAIAVVIMFMQLGFFNGFNDSQAILPPHFNADLVIMNENRVHMNKWDNLSRSRLGQALAFREVVEGYPLYLGTVGLKNTGTGMTRRILVAAFPPDADPFTVPLEPSARESLKRFGSVLFDLKSRPIYGGMEIGQRVEINRNVYTVGGFFELGPNFSNDGMLMMSDDTWVNTVLGGYGDQISFGLLRVRAGTDIDSLRAAMRASLPSDTIILTPDEMRAREIRYTIKASPIGAIFGIGLIIGFIIGIIICYQILYNEITDYLPQYATLKALGFSNRYLTGIVVQEAAILSVVGFIPGFAGSYALYRIMEAYTRIIMHFTAGRILVILLLTVLMCVMAGVIVVKKINSSDPADLF